MDGGGDEEERLEWLVNIENRVLDEVAELTSGLGLEGLTDLDNVDLTRLTCTVVEEDGVSSPYVNFVCPRETILENLENARKVHDAVVVVDSLASLENAYPFKEGHRIRLTPAYIVEVVKKMREGRKSRAGNDLASSSRKRVIESVVKGMSEKEKQAWKACGERLREFANEEEETDTPIPGVPPEMFKWTGKKPKPITTTCEEWFPNICKEQPGALDANTVLEDVFMFWSTTNGIAAERDDDEPEEVKGATSTPFWKAAATFAAAAVAATTTSIPVGESAAARPPGGDDNGNGGGLFASFQRREAEADATLGPVAVETLRGVTRNVLRSLFGNVLNLPPDDDDGDGDDEKPEEEVVLPPKPQRPSASSSDRGQKPQSQSQSQLPRQPPRLVPRRSISPSSTSSTRESVAGESKKRPNDAMKTSPVVTVPIPPSSSSSSSVEAEAVTMAVAVPGSSSSPTLNDDPLHVRERARFNANTRASSFLWWALLQNENVDIIKTMVYYKVVFDVRDDDIAAVMHTTLSTVARRLTYAYVTELLTLDARFDEGGDSSITASQRYVQAGRKWWDLVHQLLNDKETGSTSSVSLGTQISQVLAVSTHAYSSTLRLFSDEMDLRDFGLLFMHEVFVHKEEVVKFFQAKDNVNELNVDGKSPEDRLMEFMVYCSPQLRAVVDKTRRMNERENWLEKREQLSQAYRAAVKYFKSVDGVALVTGLVGIATYNTPLAQMAGSLVNAARHMTGDPAPMTPAVQAQTQTQATAAAAAAAAGMPAMNPWMTMAMQNPQMVYLPQLLNMLNAAVPVVFNANEPFGKRVSACVMFMGVSMTAVRWFGPDWSSWLWGVKPQLTPEEVLARNKQALADVIQMRADSTAVGLGLIEPSWFSRVYEWTYVAGSLEGNVEGVDPTVFGVRVTPMYTAGGLVVFMITVYNAKRMVSATASAVRNVLSRRKRRDGRVATRRVRVDAAAAADTGFYGMVTGVVHRAATAMMAWRSNPNANVDAQQQQQHERGKESSTDDLAVW